MGHLIYQFRPEAQGFLYSWFCLFFGITCTTFYITDLIHLFWKDAEAAACWEKSFATEKKKSFNLLGK